MASDKPEIQLSRCPRCKGSYRLHGQSCDCQRFFARFANEDVEDAKDLWGKHAARIAERFVAAADIELRKRPSETPRVVCILQEKTTNWVNYLVFAEVDGFVIIYSAALIVDLDADTEEEDT